MAINYDISDKSVERLNNLFTKCYDYKHWFFKVKTYDLILENTEKFVESFGDEELKKENIEEYKLALKTEIVFTFFHMAESLFSLMYCCRRSPLPWLDMKGMRVEKIVSYVKDEIVSGKITDEDVRFIFFNGVVGEEAKKDMVVNSVRFIKGFLKRAGELYINNEIYNGYKHGLRVMSKKSYLKITPENKPNPKPIYEIAGDAHVFLDTELIKKDGKEEYHQILQKTISFDYKLYLRLCIEVLRLMNNIFNTRRIKSEIKDGGSVVAPVGRFDKEDLNELFKENASTKFSFTMSCP